MKMQQWTVGILLFDQVDLTDITGPSEVFHHAGYSRRDLHKILFGRDTPENHPFLVKTVSQAGVPLKASNGRSEEHMSELQSHSDLVCRLLLEKKKKKKWKNRENSIMS